MRLDKVLVERGLVESRVQAGALIDQGVVLVGGVVALKAARLVSPAEPIELLAEAPFVSRGGEKLAWALDSFSLSVEGCTVLDAGASTGGFTDCVLQRGARTVVAVDVGHGQLHARLRADPRVRCLERTDIRSLTVAMLPDGPVDAIVADLSFISVGNVVESLTGDLVRPGGPLILLVKPQFEAGRIEVSRGKGVIRDAAIHRRTLGEAADALYAHGASIFGVVPSPITGHAGNVEFLVWAKTQTPNAGLSDLDAALDEAVAHAHGENPQG